MRDNLVDLVAHLKHSVDAEAASAYDCFLLDEGLALVAHFRKISDPAIRTSIIEMVIALAKAGDAKS